MRSEAQTATRRGIRGGLPAPTARAMGRSICRQLGWDYPTSEQAFAALPCGGYATVHPTKGPRRVSGRRLEAQRKLSQMVDGKLSA